MPKLRLCIVAACASLLPALFLAQAQTPAPLGRIEGRVLRAGTASPQPIAGVRILVTKANSGTGLNFDIPGRTQGTSLSNLGNSSFPGMPAQGQRGATTPPAPPPPLTALPIPQVTTDRDGRFVVPNLEEGSYRILITLNGFVRQEYGQRVFPGQGTLINLTAGQVLKDVTIALTPTGNVGGRLTDNEGQPAVAVPLQLLKAIYNQQGQRIFQNAGQARTNDRGEYRFYWVTPGRYYMVGGSSTANFSFPGGGGNSPNESRDTYVFTYYPGTSDISRATSIEVKPGSDLTLDFVTPKQHLYTISGKVVDPNPVATANGALPAVTLSLAFQTLTGDSGTFTMGQAYDPKTGTFTMRDVIPGSYILQAAAPPASARMPVDVTNADIEGLNVVVDGGLTVTGRFLIENGEMPAANTLRVQMRIMSNGALNFIGYSPSIQPSGDGTFTLTGVLPGQYRVVVPPSQDFYVKEVRYDRAEALNNPVEVSRRGSDSGTMEILLSRAVSQVDGVIVDDRMQPVPGVQAVLIPDNNRVRTELYKTATTDQTGRFTIRGIAPGDYKLFAWEALENNGYFDPEVMRRSESLGKPVRVGEASKLTAEAKIIPAN